MGSAFSAQRNGEESFRSGFECRKLALASENPPLDHKPHLIESHHTFPVAVQVVSVTHGPPTPPTWQLTLVALLTHVATHLVAVIYTHLPPLQLDNSRSSCSTHNSPAQHHTPWPSHTPLPHPQPGNPHWICPGGHVSTHLVAVTHAPPTPPTAQSTLVVADTQLLGSGPPPGGAAGAGVTVAKHVTHAPFAPLACASLVVHTRGAAHVHGPTSCTGNVTAAADVSPT